MCLVVLVHGLLDPHVDVEGLPLPDVQGDGQGLHLAVKVVGLDGLQGERRDPAAVKLPATLRHVLDRLDGVVPQLV